MSGTTAIQSIPASSVVGIVPSVITGGGRALDLICLMLTQSPRVPIGRVLSFPSAIAVGNYFGFLGVEYTKAAVYFAGYVGSHVLPAAVLFSQYPIVPVAAWLRGANVAALPLTALQAQSGTLTFTVDGVVQTAAGLNFGVGVTSFSSAAQAISTALGTIGAAQATLTGSLGANFTGTGAGTTLTATAVTGFIDIGSVITGVGVPVGTTIVSQSSGVANVAGTYITSNPTTASAAAIVGASTIMHVSAVASGALSIGLQLVGSGIPAGTYVTALGVGTTGGAGTYTITTSLRIVAETITASTPSVVFDSIAGAFVVTSGTTGVASTIGYGFSPTGLAATLGLTAATGAVLSQGAAATTPAQAMSAIVQQTNNWGTFLTTFDPDNGTGNAQKLAFAAWNDTQNGNYVFVCVDNDPAPTLSPAANGSFGSIVTANKYSGTVPIYTPTGSVLNLAAFLAGFVASIDFTEHNGRATAAFKGQAGLVPSVTDATTAANLTANGYNFYANFATSNDQFRWFMPGQVSGQFKWIDSYINEIWLSNEMQLALMSMLDSYKSIPYNPAGYAIIRAALKDPIDAAINFGAIRTGVPLSAAQAQNVNNAAGVPIDAILTNQGFYLQILPATAQVRAARQSPPMTLWYMDGESVQNIQLASIMIQ